MMNIPVFSQKDPRWANMVMKPSQLTMADFGCLVTSLTSVLNQFGYIDETPGTVCQKLINGGGFDEHGNLILNVVPQIWVNVALLERSKTANSTKNEANKELPKVAVENIKKLVRRGIPVLVNVDRVAGDKQEDHWIVITDDQFNVVDPAPGETAPFSKRYGDPLTGVYGYCVYGGCPMEFNDGTTEAEKDIGVTIGKLARAIRLIPHTHPAHMFIKEALEGLTR